jgi:hypothetical protein
MCKQFLILLFIPFLCGAQTPQSYLIGKKASASGYLYYRSFTIDHTKVGSADNSNFPIPVYLSGASFKTVANGGKIQNSNGYDIVFSTNSDGTGLLNFNTIYYDGVNGIWYGIVQAPSLNHSSDQVLYVNYDNSAISTAQGGSAGSSLDANYKTWWSFPDGTTLSGKDMTSNAYTLTNSGGTATSGNIDGALNLASTGHYMYSNSTASQLFNSPFHSSSVIYWTGSTESYNAIYEQNNASAGGVYAYGMYVKSDGRLATYFYNNGSQVWFDASGSVLSTSTWYLIDITWDGSTITVYLNGTSYGTNSATASAWTPTQANFYVGHSQYGSGRYFDGKINNITIENSVRNTSWITAEYNAWINNNLYSLGTETAH